MPGHHRHHRHHSHNIHRQHDPYLNSMTYPRPVSPVLYPISDSSILSPTSSVISPIYQNSAVLNSAVLNSAVLNSAVSNSNYISPSLLQPRILFPIHREISRRSSINMPLSPSLDITNVGIIFYNSNNILLVNDVSGQWTIPFGMKKIDESNKSAALRIFKTMTGSDIDEKMIISVTKNIRIHRNGNNSVIYTIISNQIIPTLSSNITNIPLDSLENLVRFNRPYGVVKNIVDFNRTLFNGLNFS